MAQIKKWALSAVLVTGILVGCGPAEVQQSVSDLGTGVTQTLNQASVDQLSAQLPSIEQAIDAGKTEEARAAFTRFLQSWDAIKVAVQQVAPESATAIQNAMDGVKQALIDAPTPTAADVKAALDELEKQLTSLGGVIN